MLQRILFDLRRLQYASVTSYGFVGLCDDSHYIIIVFHQSLQCFYCKLRGSHKYDS